MPSAQSTPLLGVLCLSVMLCLPGMAHAADTAAVRSAERTAHRGLATEADELRAVAEQFEKLRENPKERRRLIVIAQMLLGRFGYGIGPFDGRFDDKTRRAIKYYQESNALPATGELDVQTFKKLMDDSEWLEQPLVQLPEYLFEGDRWDVSVSAGGTWIIENGRHVMPLQTTKIECDRKWKHCKEFTAVVGEGNQLVLSLHDEEVERWDDQEIVTKPRTARCVTAILRLSRSQKTVTRVRTVGASEGCRDSKGQDGTLRLESGVKVWTELNHARRDGSRRVMKTGDFGFQDVKE